MLRMGAPSHAARPAVAPYIYFVGCDGLGAPFVGDGYFLQDLIFF
jgi:hypothetical protein